MILKRWLMPMKDLTVAVVAVEAEAEDKMTRMIHGAPIPVAVVVVVVEDTKIMTQ
jgi:hypothetical protein